MAVFKASAAVDALPASVTLVALIFVGSAMSFVYSFQVYQRRFMAPKQGDPGKPSPVTARFLVVALAALVLVVGLWPEPLLLLSEAAATALSSGGSS